VEVASPVAPVDSEPYRLAAYVIGRHPGFVRAWQVNLQECAHLNIAWDAIEAFRELWPEIEEEPAELEGFDDALRELTMARKVDIGILVELHRSWDSLQRASAEIVEAVSVDDRAAVAELSDHAEFEYRTVNALSELLLRGQRELDAFQQLRVDLRRTVSLVGTAVGFAKHGGPRPTVGRSLAGDHACHCLHARPAGGSQG